MPPQQGLPVHPSLPRNPLLYNNAQDTSQHPHPTPPSHPSNIGAVAVHALTSSLANPYGQAYASNHSYTNANYHSYFTQAQRPMANAQGYTLSSTYVPNMGGPSSTREFSSRPHLQHGRKSNVTTNWNSRSFGQSSFLDAGGAKCTFDGCTFTGTKTTVETHMMDRHLIFPPGWKKRRDDWDADPSLKGKPVPVPGTGVTLDTPEAIDAWLAERRKRWPSKQNVEDKKRKAQEAVERGEINPSELTLKARKKRKVDDETLDYEGTRRGRGRGHSRARGRGEWQRRSDSGWRGKGRGGGSTLSTRFELASDESPSQGCVDGGDIATKLSDDSSGEESSSGSDMDPVKDAMSSKTCGPEPGPREILKRDPDRGLEQINEADDPSVASIPELLNHMGRPIRRRKPAPQPKAPPQTPFATRPSLLRNLLLPEIRHTVSNLSQAIHFLVENDFLEGVELRPGDADSQRIKVLDSTRVTDTPSPKML